MKSRAVIVAMSLLSLFSACKPTSPPQDKWIVAESRPTDGSVGIFRYTQEKPKGWQSIPLSEEVSVSWKYEGVLPDDATSKRMDELEDALETLAVSKDSALVLVMTVGGLREWCFYARDYDDFMRTLNARLSSMPRFPISIDHSHDPEWKYWDSFVAKLR